jgi:hypothetical protein
MSPETQAKIDALPTIATQTLARHLATQGIDAADAIQCAFVLGFRLALTAAPATQEVKV